MSPRTTIASALICAAAIGASARAEQYTLMIIETPAELALREDTEKGPAYWNAYADFSRAMQTAGVLRGGAALAVDDRVRHVVGDQRRAAAGKDSVRLGGYFVIDVANLDAAMAWAAKAPTRAGVDVHPAYPAPAMQ